MELVSVAGELLQGLAERAASYRAGQTALRYLDRALWVVEKCARWAVPPPLDQDERPQPELVRPLPWVFFLTLLIILRVTRESISLVNLIMGKPPLRSADVVIFIQSKRRYLRTLKYQGNRLMRARTSTGRPEEPWHQRLHALFQFTMCFRNSNHLANNNTTSLSNNDEVFVVKRSKRGREAASPAAGGAENTMERLIERMMVDLDADSDEDSSFTLTTVTNPKSDESEFTVESDQDATYNETQHSEPQTPETQHSEPQTPETQHSEPQTPEIQNPELQTPETQHSEPQTPETQHSESRTPETPRKNGTSFSPIKNDISTPEKSTQNNEVETNQEFSTPQQESLNFIQHETSENVPRTPKNEKIANGRTVNSVPSKNKGIQNERRETDVPIARVASANNSF